MNSPVRDAMMAMFIAGHRDLNDDDLCSVAALSETGATLARHLGSVLEHTACLVMNDSNSGNFQDRESVFDLLCSTATTLDAIAGMVDVADCAKGERWRRELATGADGKGAANL